MYDGIYSTHLVLALSLAFFIVFELPAAEKETAEAASMEVVQMRLCTLMVPSSERGEEALDIVAGVAGVGVLAIWPRFGFRPPFYRGRPVHSGAACFRKDRADQDFGEN